MLCVYSLARILCFAFTYRNPMLCFRLLGSHAFCVSLPESHACFHVLEPYALPSLTGIPCFASTYLLVSYALLVLTGTLCFAFPDVPASHALLCAYLPESHALPLRTYLRTYRDPMLCLYLRESHAWLLLPRILCLRFCTCHRIDEVAREPPRPDRSTTTSRKSTTLAEGCTTDPPSRSLRWRRTAFENLRTPQPPAAARREPRRFHQAKEWHDGVLPAPTCIRVHHLLVDARGALRGGARAPGTGRRLRPPLLPSAVEFTCLLHRGTANGTP